MDITVSANAKINLYLNITGRREDGYHNIETVMHSVDLRDSVKVSLDNSGKIILTCDKPYIPTDEKNIAYKAAALFLHETGKKSGVRIEIKKRIPVGGGLGGSSTDGAAVLSALNYLSGNPFSDDELILFSSRLGADVPFCLKKGAALCSGIGDKITPLPALKNAFAVIVKPPFSLGTKDMYDRFDAFGAEKQPPDISKVTSALKLGDQKLLCKTLYNAFWNAAKQLNPEITRYTSALEQSGAEGVSMSGSGSCVFGLFNSMKKAETVKELLKSSGFSVFSTRLI